MVAVAQLVERLVVVQEVASSIPAGHPNLVSPQESPTCQLRTGVPVSVLSRLIAMWGDTDGWVGSRL